MLGDVCLVAMIPIEKEDSINNWPEDARQDVAQLLPPPCSRAGSLIRHRTTQGDVAKQELIKCDQQVEHPLSHLQSTTPVAEVAQTLPAGVAVVGLVVVVVVGLALFVAVPEPTTPVPDRVTVVGLAVEVVVLA